VSDLTDMSDCIDIVCFVSKPQQRRFLVPVAAAAGWRMVAGKNPDVQGCVVVCVCYADERRALDLGARGTVLMEHGLGQCYSGMPSDGPWSAGRGWQRGRLGLLMPGPYARDQHQAGTALPVLQVGSPYLDAWVGRSGQRDLTGRKPVVAVSTHWDCHACPETRSAWPWIVEEVERLGGDGRWQVLGHYHPHERRTGTLEERLRVYRRAGIEVVDSWPEVMMRADLYVTDNSSSLYEFAALGKPVVVLSPPWYRRHVRHGLRFWDALPGLEVVRAEDLRETVAAALADDAEGAALRARAVPLAWGELDGGAAVRAVGAIEQLRGTLA
jgi:hypothetical protein